MHTPFVEQAKLPKLYSFTSWWQLENRVRTERLRAAIEARRLALLSVADPHNFKTGQEK